MLDIARKGVPGAVFVEGDAQRLPFPDKDFDIVVSNFGICHVPDQPSALAEAHRVLRTGGRFAMTVWCGPDASPCFEVLYGAVKKHGSAEVSVPSGPDFHQFAKSQVAQDLLSRAGFSDVRLNIADCFFDLDKPERLCEIFENATVRAANLLAAQPPDRLLEIRSAVAAMVRNRFSIGGRWRVPMPATLVSARKTAKDL
jgi:SAM-dependent methyltransferase